MSLSLSGLGLEDNELGSPKDFVDEVKEKWSDKEGNLREEAEETA
ncbi:MAG: hypothetical protein ABEJ07_03110 [Candidatus Nanohaloarchaea archaeon]